MFDRIQEIDTGAIEELTRIKRDQEVLEDRLRLMVERREGVSEVVFERVRGDYRKRLDALDHEARPLKKTAGREYAKLQALRTELSTARDEAQLEREEIEFRNGLGEFAAEEYERRSTECAKRVSDRDGELTEVEALRERFLASCRSAEELESPGDDTESGLPVGAAAEPDAEAASRAATMEPAVEEPVAPAAAPEPELAPAAAAAPLVAAQEAVAETPAPPPMYYEDYDSGATSMMAAAPAGRDEDDGTLLNRPQTDDEAEPAPGNGNDDWHEAPTGSFEVPPLPPAAARDEVEEEGLEGATRILSRPRLVEMENGASGREHALALGRTSIGRASDNLVHLLDEAVSRHHAEVVPGPKGYLIRDLGSENGIFVNGDRTPEHVLRDGDVVQIGARTLVFHGA
jgi:hypothetical protein